ncbi:hypothetical protein Xhom_05010 [Xenorhabdus hominickii]|uniref:Uncharacterized protein n=1 Tax=Xenorhabdus hominickii TaxID=351679 RepID=A0A2G0PRG3_XENHO|nr:hypothetical protein Xhom_05010 [Xenorhabdus hominickii]
MHPVNHHRLFHLRMGCQGGFNFPEFNAVTADFDLKIIAPQIIQLAVRPPAHPIAGFIQAGIAPRVILFGRKRVGDKPGRGQFRLIPVPPCQPGAADIQFPRRPAGRQLTGGIQHIQPGIINPLPNCPVPVLQPVLTGADGDFSRAVLVKHRDIRPDSQRIQRFTAGMDNPQGGVG